ncbi:uncharacterized protein FFB20_09390 [Fusarium fujikuroi]|nr:uncharacterized protein FFB20_09390 [Fusarium fujikuroi]SCN95603.1 uncharacterized protein FFE2_08266 [Fusarium fujikuroi]SCO01472.1 uncharacterized protein FFM5_07590 [Fusarium fujikuroi]SCO21347.1 uncharacterized protein FFC1_14131 [Fusarium fujikuroi]SCO46046.1 uncharacterized protein FFNC_10647 [Fusarium fujikuroi]
MTMSMSMYGHILHLSSTAQVSHLGVAADANRSTDGTSDAPG